MSSRATYIGLWRQSTGRKTGLWARQLRARVDRTTTPGFEALQGVKGKLYFPRVFHFFDTKGAFCPDHPSFPHMTFQSLGYVMKRATAFRACPPSVLGGVRVFVRAVGTENSEKTKKSGGSGEKVIFVGEM